MKHYMIQSFKLLLLVVKLLLGSGKRFWSTFSIIFLLDISEAKFHIAVSFFKLIVINLGEHLLVGELSINMKYGWLSDNCLIMIHTVYSRINLLIL